MAAALSRTRWLSVGLGAGLIGLAASTAVPLARTEPEAVIISGTVIDEVGEPVVGVFVSTVSGASKQNQLTGEGGRFRFVVGAGSYTLSAKKAGYVDAEHGQRFPGDSGRPVTVAEGEQSHTGLRLRIWRLGILTGRMLSDKEPLIGAAVRALELVEVNGVPQLRKAGSAATDDRGEYRISVPPGRYAVAVLRRLNGAGAEPGVDGRSIATTFAPGVHSSALAQLYSVLPATEHLVPDMDVPSVPLGTLHGRIVTTGKEVPPVAIRLTPFPMDQPPTDLDPIQVLSRADGSFEIKDLPVGEYDLAAVEVRQSAGGIRLSAVGNTFRFVGQLKPGVPLARASTARTGWTRLRVTVAKAGEAPVEIELKEGLAVSGRFTFGQGQGSPTADQLLASPIWLQSVDPPYWSSQAGRIEPDGSFLLPAVPGGRYVLRFLMSFRGWVVLESKMQGRTRTNPILDLESGDIRDLEIVMSSRPGAITGRVTDHAGRPVQDATVVLFSQDRLRWRSAGVGLGNQVRSARTGSDGRYSLGGLPAGKYLIVAKGADVPRVLAQEETLIALARSALSIQLLEGDIQTHHFKIDPKMP